MDFRRLLYGSVARGDDIRSDRIDILRQSRANNGLNGVSGLLWTDNARYLQVLEGSPDAVQAVFERIAFDKRHEKVRVLVDTMEPQRVFSDWSMASLLPGETDPELQMRLGRLLRSAPAEVRAEFEAVVVGTN